MKHFKFDREHRLTHDWDNTSDTSSLLKDEAGLAIIPIDHMLEMIDRDKPLVISLGYEHSECNDEGLVDYDTVIQFYLEDKFYTHSMKTKYSKATLDLYGTLLESKCRAEFEDEFPNDRNSEISRIVDGRVVMTDQRPLDHWNMSQAEASEFMGSMRYWGYATE